MAKVIERERRADQSLVGSFKRFGPYGVAYEVIKVGNDSFATVRVVDTATSTVTDFLQGTVQLKH